MISCLLCIAASAVCYVAIGLGGQNIYGKVESPNRVLQFAGLILTKLGFGRIKHQIKSNIKVLIDSWNSLDKI